MNRARVRASPPPPARADLLDRIVVDRAILEAYLEDASGAGPGTASGLARPETEDEVAGLLAATDGPVLPQAARSSLTGGGAPRGETVVSVERLAGIGPIHTDGDTARVRVQAGVRLRDLQRALAERGWYYPPVPTYQEAMIGGTVATNAGGAATFKYGVTRAWVESVRVALADGAVLDIERGEAVVTHGGVFEVERPGGRVVEVPTPSHRLPDLKKVSAGYHAAEALDLVDLFVGSEGTLGVVTSVGLRLAALPPTVLVALAFVTRESDALELNARLRDLGARARSGDLRCSPDVRAIELVDGAALDLLRSHGDVARLRVSVPDDARAALLFEVECPRRLADDEVLLAVESALDGGATPGLEFLDALFFALAGVGALDTLELAMPDDPGRGEALREFREAVPKRVNEIVTRRRASGGGIRKIGGDLIVPVARIGTVLERFRADATERGLELVVWGHCSDGNLHPNVLASDGRDVEAGERALLGWGDLAVDLGGAPLSEHGVGRSPLKQEMMRRFVGGEAVERMRAIKRALDPTGRMAPGVLLAVR